MPLYSVEEGGVDEGENPISGFPLCRPQQFANSCVALRQTKLKQNQDHLEEAAWRSSHSSKIYQPSDLGCKRRGLRRGLSCLDGCCATVDNS